MAIAPLLILNKILMSLHLQGSAKLLLRRVLQFVVAFTATLGTISDGMHYGWSSPIIPQLLSGNTTIRNVTARHITILETIYMIGGFVAIPITVYTVDRVGRKVTILLGGVGGLVGWIMIALARDIRVIFVARFISGLTSIMAFVAAPMYIAEIADSAIRGFLSGYYNIAIFVGVLIVYSIGPFVKLSTTSLVGCCILTLQFLTFSFMPRSPYFLMMKNQKAACREALNFFQAGEDVDTEMKSLEIAIENQGHDGGNPLDLFRIRSNRLGIIITFALNAAQHFGGITVMVMNIREILELTENSKSASYSGILFCALMLISSLVSIVMIDRFGRKNLYACSGFMTGFSINILATYFAIRQNGYDVTHFAWVPISAAYLYGISFRLGMGTVPIVLTAELFPTEVKALGITLSHTAFTLFSALSLMGYQALKPFGLYVPFYIASISCLVAVAFMMIYVPETKGQTLQEIQSMLKEYEPSCDVGDIRKFFSKK